MIQELSALRLRLPKKLNIDMVSNLKNKKTLFLILGIILLISNIVLGYQNGFSTAIWMLLVSNLVVIAYAVAEIYSHEKPLSEEN